MSNQKNLKRTHARELLKKWGNWPVMMEHLLRERSKAQACLGEDSGALGNSLLAEIDANIEALISTRNVIAKLVAQLPFEEFQVLILRYEKNMTWVQIGKRLSYDERTVRRYEVHAADTIAGWLES